MADAGRTPGGRIGGRGRVRSLSDELDASQVGGKAGRLARVQRLGFRVPRTRVLGRDALGLFLAANGLGPLLETYLGTEDRSGLEPAFERISAAVAQMVVPAELRDEILAAAGELLRRSPCGLAVRSSAIYEDSDRASFAGVFDSFVGVLDPKDVLRKVVDCWTSLWSPRALRYMDRMGLEPVRDGMAVMLQEVVPAVGSGVIYTADPKTGNPWRFGISATPGLSVDLLSGSGVGDSFVVDWETGAVLEREIVAKPFELRATPDGMARVAVEDPVSTTAAVSDAEIVEISRVGRALDEALDTRLDIEWALTPEGVTVLQARPLTALPPFFPVELTGEAARRSWKPALATLPLRPDRPPHRLTPLYRHESESEMWHRYQPKDIVLTSICRHELDVHGYRYWEADEQPTFQDFFDGPGEYEAWIASNEGGYRRRWDRREVELQTIRQLATQGLASTTASTPTARTLIPVLLEVMDRLWDLNAFGWSGPQALGWMCQAALDAFLEEHGRLEEHGVEADTAVLLGGERDSYTFQAGLAQQRLGRSIREPAVIEAFEGSPLDAVVPRLLATAPECDFLARLEAFCWRFGKSPPSWLGRPALWSMGAADVQIVSAVKNAWSGKSRDIEGVHEASRKRRREQEGKIRAVLAEAGDEVLERFDRLLAWARYWGQALNDRHGLTAGLLHERELVWQVGSRLLDEGLLERAEDILVLERRDLEEIARTGVSASSREVYRQHLHEERRTLRLTPPPALGALGVPEETGKGEPAGAPEAIDREGRSGELRGRGYGGGAAVGRARKIVRLDPESLEALGDEDVLVLPHETAFHYADWHSLLTLVCAVVSPGRPSHHLAQVVARECGVPLVGHVVGDLDRIPEGKKIRVDGSTGRVVPIG